MPKINVQMKVDLGGGYELLFESNDNTFLLEDSSGNSIDLGEHQMATETLEALGAAINRIQTMHEAKDPTPASPL